MEPKLSTLIIAVAAIAAVSCKPQNYETNEIECHSVECEHFAVFWKLQCRKPYANANETFTVKHDPIGCDDEWTAKPYGPVDILFLNGNWQVSIDVPQHWMPRGNTEQEITVDGETTYIKFHPVRRYSSVYITASRKTNPNKGMVVLNLRLDTSVRPTMIIDPDKLTVLIRVKLVHHDFSKSQRHPYDKDFDNYF